MNFKKSRPLLLVGAALVASIAVAASSASAQQRGVSAQGADCVLGAGSDCQDTFSAARSSASAAKQAAPAQTTAVTSEPRNYGEYVEMNRQEATGLSNAIKVVSDRARATIAERCDAVSPNASIRSCN